MSDPNSYGSGSGQPGSYPSGQPGSYPSSQQVGGPGQQPYGAPGFPNYPSAPSYAAEAPVATGPGGAPLSGWWRRVGATIIDGIIYGIVGTIIALLIGNHGRNYIVGAVGLVYLVLLLGRVAGQTVGNMAVRTRVIGIDGAPIGYPRALLRWFIEELLGITVIGGILDVLWPLWDRQNQTLHDKAANSLVIRV